MFLNFRTLSCLAQLQVPVKINEYCNEAYWRGQEEYIQQSRGQETV